MAKNIILAVFFLCSCAANKELAHPEKTLKRFARYIKTKEYKRAYVLMSKEYRARYSQKDFIDAIKNNRERTKDYVEQLERKTKSEVVATYDFEDRRRIVLALESNDWKIKSDPIDFYVQDTPLNALQSFIRAIENKRVDMVIRFVPKRWVKNMTPDKIKLLWDGARAKDTERMINELKLVVKKNRHIKVREDRAELSYGDGKTIKFIREDHLWKIEDPD